MTKLNEHEEILFRQIHPNYMSEVGEPSSDRFRPSETDLGRLSLDRSSLTSAASSHSLYISSGRKSAAVFGVSVAEFAQESIACLADPQEANPPHPKNAAHALADFTPHESKSHKLIAKRLVRLAIARGQIHPPREEM